MRHQLLVDTWRPEGGRIIAAGGGQVSVATRTTSLITAADRHNAVTTTRTSHTSHTFSRVVSSSPVLAKLPYSELGEPKEVGWESSVVRGESHWQHHEQCGIAECCKTRGRLHYLPPVRQHDQQQEAGVLGGVVEGRGTQPRRPSTCCSPSPVEDTKILMRRNISSISSPSGCFRWGHLGNQYYTPFSMI